MKKKNFSKLKTKCPGSPYASRGGAYPCGGGARWMKRKDCLSSWSASGKKKGKIDHSSTQPPHRVRPRVRLTQNTSCCFFFLSDRPKVLYRTPDCFDWFYPTAVSFNSKCLHLISADCCCFFCMEQDRSYPTGLPIVFTIPTNYSSFVA